MPLNCIYRRKWYQAIVSDQSCESHKRWYLLWGLRGTRVPRVSFHKSHRWYNTHITSISYHINNPTLFRSSAEGQCWQRRKLASFKDFIAHKKLCKCPKMFFSFLCFEQRELPPYLALINLCVDDVNIDDAWANSQAMWWEITWHAPQLLRNSTSLSTGSVPQLKMLVTPQNMFYRTVEL